MISEKVLWEDKWLKVIRYDGYYTGVKCTHNGVMVLGYRNSKEVLVRLEKRPCHGEGILKSSVTGARDDSRLSVRQTAIKELREETGYMVEDEDELNFLGKVFPSNFSATKIHVYAMDLTGYKQGEIVNDGSEGEAGSGAEWMNWWKAIDLNCPLIGYAVAHLLKEGKLECL